LCHVFNIVLDRIKYFENDIVFCCYYVTNSNSCLVCSVYISISVTHICLISML